MNRTQLSSENRRLDMRHRTLIRLMGLPLYKRYEAVSHYTLSQEKVPSDKSDQLKS